MTSDEIIDEAFAVFGAVERPEHFTNHEHCPECKEHDDTLLAFDPRSITREALGGMGWDPITFTTDDGFRYYLPGLIRIVLTETGDNSYYEQFLWHTVGGGGYERVGACSAVERDVVARALEYLFENRMEALEQECLEDEILAALEKWTTHGE